MTEEKYNPQFNALVNGMGMAIPTGMVNVNGKLVKAVEFIEELREDIAIQGFVWSKKRNSGKSFAQLELLSRDLNKGNVVYYYGPDPLKELPAVMTSLKKHFDTDATYELFVPTKHPLLTELKDQPKKDIYIIKKKDVQTNSK